MDFILHDNMEFEYNEEIGRDLDYIEDEPGVIYVEGAADEIYQNAPEVFYEELSLPDNDDEIQYIDSNNYEYTAQAWRLHHFPETNILPTYRIAGNAFNSTGCFVRDTDGAIMQNNVIRIPNMGLDIRKIQRLNLTPRSDLGTEHDDLMKRNQHADLEEEEDECPPHSSLILTPLPDKFFVRRSTGSAQLIGFQSLAALCHTCMFAFRTKTAYQKHMEQHNDKSVEVQVPRSHVYCPKLDCEVRCDCVATLVEHVRTYHGQEDLVFESIEFTDMSQFKKWKSEMERLTNSRYTRSSGKHNVFSKSTYFQCHFSGSANNGKDPNAQGIRNRGSKKMGRSCTAFLHLKEREDGRVELRGCVKHTGHDETARNMPLTDDIKRDIAVYLLQGLTEHEIVDLMRQGCTADDRRYYIQAYEVRNVQTKLNKHQKSMAKNVQSKTSDYITSAMLDDDVVRGKKRTPDDPNASELSKNSRPSKVEGKPPLKSKKVVTALTAKPPKPTNKRDAKQMISEPVDCEDVVSKVPKTIGETAEIKVVEESKPQFSAAIIEKSESIDHSLFVKRKIDPETLRPVKKGPKPKATSSLVEKLKEQAEVTASGIPSGIIIKPEDKPSCI